MTRIGRDALRAATIPHAGLQIVMGYADTIKLKQWSAAEWNLFPDIPHVEVVKKSSSRFGHVGDCEKGDMTPAGAAAWARQRRRDGFAFPCVYTSVANQSAVIAAFRAIGEPLPLWWLAHYDNVAVLPAGCVAKQYKNTSGYDESIVADYWPGVDATPRSVINTSGKDSDMGGMLPLTVDNTTGHAYATFTTGASSQVISKLWIDLRALYGSAKKGIMGAHLNWLMPDGTSVGYELIDLPWNKFVGKVAPIGAAGVTVDWTPAMDGTVVSGVLEYLTK